VRIIGVVLGLFAIVSLAGAVAALSSNTKIERDVPIEQTLVIDN
jgi:hypothetical protein